MTYAEFTNKMINKYGESWLLSQYGKNESTGTEIDGKYWCEDEIFDELADAGLSEETQPYFMWLDVIYEDHYTQLDEELENADW